MWSIVYETFEVIMCSIVRESCCGYYVQYWARVAFRPATRPLPVLESGAWGVQQTPALTHPQRPRWIPQRKAHSAHKPKILQ